MHESNLSSISKAQSLEEMGEFWDTHDFTDFDTSEPDIEFTVAHTVAIEAELFWAVEDQAHRRGVSTETLVNLWLQEKLAEQIAMAAV
jgi:hypothetical protein